MFHTRLNNFRDINFAIALYVRSGNKLSNLNELKFDVKFCEIYRLNNFRDINFATALYGCSGNKLSDLNELKIFK